MPTKATFKNYKNLIWKIKDVILNVTFHRKKGIYLIHLQLLYLCYELSQLTLSVNFNKYYSLGC